MAKNSYRYKGIDFVGQRHGRLEVISKAERGRSWWVCKCDCGNIVKLPTWRFLENQSCGCFEQENLAKIGKDNRTHGKTETRLYRTWCKMKERCNNPNIEHYPEYGGRGIKVCDEWNHSFENFQKWAYSAGYDDNCNGNQQSLDRIDVQGNYEPNNCRWVTHKEQMRNTTRTVYIDYHGEKIPMSAFCEEHGITYDNFVTRYLERGYTVDELLRIWRFSKGDHENYYSLDEASAYYGVGKQSVMNWIKSGKLKAEKVGNSWYVPFGQKIERRADRDKM